MKILISTILLSILSSNMVFGQIIPLGIYIDIDGKIKFWEMEANRNGHLDDTVFITFDGKTNVEDLRNFKYNRLTLVEAPKEKWTFASNYDPSIHYDTVDHVFSEKIDFEGIYVSPSLFDLMYVDSSVIVDPKTPKRPYFSDDVRGLKLTDSVVKIVKSKLIDFIANYHDKYVSQAERQKLSQALSLPDTMIDYHYVFDYLVDLAVMYDYDKKERLTRVIGYHWDYFIEVDNLKYNKAGDLIYFSRQSIGSILNEYFFTYDKSRRVSTLTTKYTSVGANSEEAAYDDPSVNRMKFTYDISGKMNSRSYLQKNGSWLTEQYRFP